MLVRLLVSLLFLTAMFSKAQVKSDTIRVFFLGGQSNMDGYGYIKDLPPQLNKTFQNAFIFHGHSAPDNDLDGGIGNWEKLRPGHGVGFNVDKNGNQISDRFGLELSLVDGMLTKHPNWNIALIKYSRGGTSIDSLAAGDFGSWEPDFRSGLGVNQYDHALKTLRNAFVNKDINNNGIEDFIIPTGIFWMQGEADAAFTEEIAFRYEKNLKRLMDLLRAAMRADGLPIVIGKISDSWQDKNDGLVYDYGDLVQHAQENYARSEPNISIVRNTRYYKFSDPWHFDSDGYLNLGYAFAKTWINIECH